MKSHLSQSVALFSAVILVFSASPASHATPRYAAKYKQTCNLCHHNPTGGGMRSPYGAQFFSYMELPWKPLEDFAELENIKPKLSDQIQAGVDFRTIYWNSDNDTMGSSFLAMQGDLYFAFTPSDKLLIYLEKGIQSSFEAFALLQGLPMSGALKMGRFIPAYGWRFPDHKAFTREYLGFSQYPQYGPKLIEDSGVELGFYPMEWELVASITNGAAGIIDSDRGKAFTARALKRLSVGPISLTAGGSYRYGEFASDNPLLRYAGGFWGANIARLSYVGETDWILRGGVTSIVTSHEASWRFRPGFDLCLGWDFYDADIDNGASGFAWRSKWSSELFLTGYLELIPAFYWHNYNGYEYGLGELQIHVWF